MNIRSYAWTFPFIVFILGYMSLNIFISGPTIDAPNLIGKMANEALVITSNNNLCLKIIGEKEDAELPEGTILHQTPTNQKVKRNQAIFVLISKKPQLKTVPNLLNKKESEIDKILLESNLKAKKYYINNCPLHCFCQYPEPGQQVTKEKIIIYLGSSNPKPSLFPNLKEEPLGKVIDFLKLNNFDIKVFRKGKEESKYNLDSIVIKQKPLAGSIINTKNISTVLVEIN